MSYAEATTGMIDGLSIVLSKTDVFLGITIDHKLKFDDRANYLCKRAGLKLNVFACIAPFMNVGRKPIVMKSFIKS